MGPWYSLLAQTDGHELQELNGHREQGWVVAPQGKPQPGPYPAVQELGAGQDSNLTQLWWMGMGGGVRGYNDELFHLPCTGA